MSAFFVGKATIDAVLELHLLRNPEASLSDCEDLGRTYWSLNAVALEARYGDDPAGFHSQIDAYRFTRRNLGLAEMVKSADCLSYQCSEGDIPETSPVYRRIRELADHFDQGGLRSSAEYDDAPWGLCADINNEKEGA